MVRFALLDAAANVLCPATKLWNTGDGATVMREAVSLMGGYGITEDCPGFLGKKWMDAQLEATYEGPEAVQRRQLSVTMANPLFLAQLKAWIRELRQVASEHPGTGACALASAMELWLWTLPPPRGRDRRRRRTAHLVAAPGRDLQARRRARLAHGVRGRRSSTWSGFTGRAARSSATRTPARSGSSPTSATCRRRARRARSGRICAELVHGYNRHPAWDEDGRKACWSALDAEALEGIVPGLAGCAMDELEPDGEPPGQGGPLRVVQGDHRLPDAAREARRLPHRRDAREGPRRRGRLAGDDPRGARLPAVGEERRDDGTPVHGGRHRLRGLRPGDGRLPHDALAPPRRAGSARRSRAPRRPGCRCRSSATSAPTIPASASRAS